MFSMREGLRQGSPTGRGRQVGESVSIPVSLTAIGNLPKRFRGQFSHLSNN